MTTTVRERLPMANELGLAFRTTGLTSRYGHVTAVDGVDLRVPTRCTVRRGDHGSRAGCGDPSGGWDRQGEGAAWNNLGLALVSVRRFEEAITAYQRDIAICAELEDRYGQAQTLENLGRAHVRIDNPGQARRVWADAVELFTAVEALYDVARVQQRLADLDR